MRPCHLLVYPRRPLIKVEIRTVQKVDDTMAAINEQRELANEIADTISQPLGMPFEDVSPKEFLTSTRG